MVLDALLSPGLFSKYFIEGSLIEGTKLSRISDTLRHINGIDVAISQVGVFNLAAISASETESAISLSIRVFNWTVREISFISIFLSDALIA
jgi:hypothetical protein